MNWRRFARDTLRDDRAREPIEWYSRTVIMVAAWGIWWIVVAPVLGVRMPGLGELLHALYVLLSPILPPSIGIDPVSVQMGAEVVIAASFWTFPLYAGLFGVCTLLSGLQYLVRRWQRPPPTLALGGDS